MGNKASTTINDYIQNNINFQTDINTTLTTSNTADVNSTSIQSMNINVGGGACCMYNPTPTTQAPIPGCVSFAGPVCADGDFDINQLSNSTQNVYQSNNLNFSSTVSANLQATVDNEIDTAIKNIQTTDWSTVFPNESKIQVATKFKNTVNDFLKANTTIDSINSSLNNSWNQQSLTMQICAPLSGESCTITQETSTDITVQNILSTVANLAASNTAIVNYYNKLTQAVTTEQSGFFSALFNAIGSFFKSIGIIGIAIFGSAIAVLAILFLVGIYLIIKH